METQTMKQTDYEKQGLDFLAKTNTKFTAKCVRHDYHFIDDKQKRDIYQVTLKRGGRTYKFNFGQSIANSRPNEPKEPTA